MRVLVCGADGFLGSAIARALEGAGHHVIRAVRTARRHGDIVIDFRADMAAQTWLPRLRGVDAVVNAVGIIREKAAGDFDRIHRCAPAALFAACKSAGVRRVVQISALGQADTPYLASKRAADAALLEILPGAVVLRPGLVFGADGASTRFFLALASLPLQFRPAGAGTVQPVHVDDVAAVVLRLIAGKPVAGGVLELPGPRRLPYAQWIAAYRAGLGLAPTISLPVPAWLMSAAARLAGHTRGSLLSADTWAMLRAGSTADHAPAEALLGRPLRAPEQFFLPGHRELLRLRALARWRTPLLRLVLALLWLAAALLSAGLYPVGDSLALLSAYGLGGTSALIVLAAASVLDLVMGILTLLRPGQRLWLSQLALVGAYTLLVALRLPGFLLHPFSPIVKNLAVAALLVQLWAEEPAP